MATIYNNIEKVAGQAQEGVLVTITLLWDKDESIVAKIDDEDTMVQGSFGTSTDEDGRWEQATIVTNDSITPAGSVYSVTERLAGTESAVTYYVSVPDGATPVYWVGDILVDKPEVWIVTGKR